VILIYLIGSPARSRAAVRVQGVRQARRRRAARLQLEREVGWWYGLSLNKNGAAVEGRKSMISTILAYLISLAMEGSRRLRRQRPAHRAADTGCWC